MVRKWDARVFRHLLKLSISWKEQQRAECLSKLLREYKHEYAAHRDRLGGKIKALEAILAEIPDQSAASMAIKIGEMLDNPRSSFLGVQHSECALRGWADGLNEALELVRKFDD